MPLQTTGPISWDDIRAQFGGGYPIVASDYYAGGPRVPAGTTGINGAIPTTGPISPWHFYGAPVGGAAPLVSVGGGTIYATGAGTIGTYARYILTASGLEQSKSGGAAIVTIGTWLLSGVASSYEVRANLISDDGGAVASGAGFGVWLSLGSDREWIYGNGGVGETGTLLFQIEVRLASTGVAQDSAAVQLVSSRVFGEE